MESNLGAHGCDPDAQACIDNHHYVGEGLDDGMDKPCFWRFQKSKGNSAQRKEDDPSNTANTTMSFDNGKKVGWLCVRAFRDGWVFHCK